MIILLGPMRVPSTSGLGRQRITRSSSLGQQGLHAGGPYGGLKRGWIISVTNSHTAMGGVADAVALPSVSRVAARPCHGVLKDVVTWVTELQASMSCALAFSRQN